MRFFAVALIFFGVAASYAQAPEVPHKMQFAGMVLTLRDDARREIQTDVDALTRSPKHFAIKVERARTYFPIIEKIFAEEALPDDFKYLVLQESALIADAVSVSKAVGFWQFKDFTALEMGLRVDKEIDERMNLVSATRGAARYLKKSNNFFDNWLCALQSYQMGAGGVQRAVGEKHNGARHMEITSDTYWYVKKFIAHKVAFENALAGEPQLKIMDYQPPQATTLKDVASLLAIDEERLTEFNKWALKGIIPADRKYTILIPTSQVSIDVAKLVASSASPPATTLIEEPTAIKKIQINGLRAVQAQAGETLTSMAARINIDLSDFLIYNDISIDHSIKANHYYFMERKKSKAEKNFHSIAAKESLWDVSQKYGIQLKKLKKYNRLHDERVKPGTTLWLSAKMPKGKDYVPAVADTNVVAISEEEFDWELNEVKETSQVKNEISVASLHADSVKKSLPVLVNSDTVSAVTGTQKNHVVLKGETMYSIAKVHGVGVSELAQWNALDLQQPLATGQSLKIVANEVVEVPAKADYPSLIVPVAAYHEVKSSDTLYSVARQYGVTIKELMDWNAKTDFTLSVGEKLKVIRK